MLTYPQINPIAFSLGPLKVHWYGIMYLVGFVMAWLLGVYRAKQPYQKLVTDTDTVTDILFYGAIGVILGGRIGYIVFYNLSYYWAHPLQMLYVWDGGMSFHGGLIGVILAAWLYSRKLKCNLFDLTDFFAPMVPIGLGAGRLGNFINGELYGRVTHSWIGMVYPKGGPLPRYPSELFEFALEGVLLFIVLWCLSIKPRPRMFISSQFLIFYAIFRFTCEFYRQPDPQLGFVAFGWMTQGQLLCIPMFILGLFLLYWVYRRGKHEAIS